MSGTGRRGSAPALIALVLAAAGMVLAAGGGQDELRSVLPADGAVPGWSRDGDLQEFVGEDLFTYINGGAEIYHEFGFRRVVVQDYQGPAGKSVSLEIFEMETPAAAYGMFTFKRSGQGRGVPLGSAGELEDYYLNFWKGRFLVTLTGFDAATPTLDGLLAVAGAVDGKLTKGDGVPDLVAALPGDGLKPQSVKYLKGLLGLNNIYPFYTARGLAFKEAARGLYEDGESLILLDFGSSEARREAWVELRAGLEKTGRFEQPTNYLADAVVFKDGKGQYIAIAEVGPRLAIGIHSTLEWALATVARVR